MTFNKACLYSQFEDLQLSMACSQVIWLCTVEDFIIKAFIALNNLHDQSLLFQNYLLKLVRSRCIVIQIPPKYYSIFTAVESFKWRMDQHFDTFCGTKAKFSLVSSQENVGCSNKRLWEEGFKEVAIYQIKWQRFMELWTRSSVLRMITGRKIEIHDSETGLLRIEGKATNTGYSLFCVCSEVRTVYYSYYIHK